MFLLTESTTDAAMAMGLRRMDIWQIEFMLRNHA
jgi:hypothetical protein